MLMFVALFAAANPASSPPLPPTPREELILVDDRLVKDQVAGAVVIRAIDDIHARTAVRVTAFSLLKGVDPVLQKKLDGCASNTCLAEVGRALKADVVLTLRAAQQEGVYVVTVSRVPALAKLKDREEVALARTPEEVALVVDDKVRLLFPTARGVTPPPPPRPGFGPLDGEGCIAEPDRRAVDARAPTPFELCRAQIGEIRPLPVFDEAASTARRARDKNACCYRLLGNR